MNPAACGVLALCFLLTGCSGKVARLTRQAGELAEQLKAASTDDERATCVEKLIAIGAPAAAPITALLTEDSPAVRASAAQALGGITGGDSAVLLPLLADDDLDVRVAAVRALGARKHYDAYLKLVDASESEEPRLRAAGVLALADLARPTMVKQVADALDDPDAVVRQAAVDGLVTLGAFAIERVNGLVATAASEPLTSSARQAHQALVDHFIANLESTDKMTRVAAANALRRLNDPRAVKPLAVALADTEKEVRLAAIRALDRWNEPAALPAVRAAMEDDYPPVAIQATITAARLGDAGAIASLVKDLASTDGVTRGEAVDGLSAVGEPAASALMDVLKTPDRDQTWCAAARLLGGMNWEPARRLLMNALGDARSEVRMSAVVALTPMLRAEDAELMVGLLDDDDDGVRHYALTALVALGQPAAPVLVRRLGSHPTRRLMMALARIGGRTAVGALVDMASSDDVSVRTAAIDALSACRGPQAVDYLRRLAAGDDALAARAHLLSPIPQGTSIPAAERPNPSAP